MTRTVSAFSRGCAVALALALQVAIADDARAVDIARNNYFYAENWLCRPGHEAACEGGLTATVVRPDGKPTRQVFHADRDAPIDCFYVYPTVSRQQTPLSNMTAGREEKAIVQQQFAPFGAKCRLYAPLYRQVTQAALEAEAHGTIPDFDPITPARDVVDAWNTYIAHDNAGRGFVVIGHSQGAAILKNIIAVLIDGTPLARQFVSAIIPGTDVDVPQGQDVGGTFAGVPLCHSADQTGCVVVYSSFLATDPPGPDANFGISARPQMRDGCTNPALLATGGTTLAAVLPASFDDMKTRFRTPFFETPGLLSGVCVAEGKHTYLAISVGQDRRAPRVLPLLHDVARNHAWGLHDLDINLALGDLVALVGSQSKAWLARHGRNAGGVASIRPPDADAKPGASPPAAR
jgi:hypothetical protein